MGFDDCWLLTKALTQISAHWYYGNHTKSFCGVFLKNCKYSWEIFWDMFFEICSRCLKNVTQKTSFSRCFWDALETSQKDIFLEMYLKRLKEKSHLLWDVSKEFLRCLSQWRSDWDLSETFHAGWGVTIW